jgi:hypothetical protein
MSRIECEGCEFYDPYPCSSECTYYDEFVECITRCEHRTKKGKRINDANNPLIMERITRWNEVIFDGDIRSRQCDFYNPNGIIVWGDGSMHDPQTKKTVCPDGTVIENDHWGGNTNMRQTFDESMRHFQKIIKGEL